MDDDGSGTIKASSVDWEERINIASSRHEPPPPYSSVRLYKPYMESNNNNSNHHSQAGVKVEHPLPCTQALAPELITYYQLLKSFYDNASRLNRDGHEAGAFPPLLPSLPPHHHHHLLPPLPQTDRSKSFNISNLIATNQSYQHHHQQQQHQYQQRNSQEQIVDLSQAASKSSSTLLSNSPFHQHQQQPQPPPPLPVQQEPTEANVIKKNININIEKNGCDGHQHASDYTNKHESNNIVINSVDVSINVSSNNNCSESELKISCKTTPPKKRYSSSFGAKLTEDTDEDSPSKMSVKSEDTLSGREKTTASEPITSTYLQMTRSMGLSDDDALNLVSFF